MVPIADASNVEPMGWLEKLPSHTLFPIVAKGPMGYGINEIGSRDITWMPYASENQTYVILDKVEK